MPQIKAGQTPFRELFEILGFEAEEALEKRRARLFPTGNTELENPTTSIFLASLAAVKEYREELLSEIGFNKIKNKNIQVHVFTEIRRQTHQTEERPDGLIVVTSGKNNPLIEWTAFVETKVGNNKLTPEQVDRYIDFGKEVGIDNIITISNYMVTAPENSPFVTRKRNFGLYHWSWTYLKVTAKRLIRANLISDNDHIFILSELRRYFDSHTKLTNFANMGGKDWKEAIQKCRDIKTGKLPNSCTEILVDAYKQEEKDIALQLTDRNTRGLYIKLNDSKGDRVRELSEDLSRNRKFVSTFIINQNKNWRFSIIVYISHSEIECITQINIDKGKAQAQTSELLNLLQNAGYTSDILINPIYPRNKTLEGRVTLQKLIEEKNSKNKSTYSTVNKALGDEIKYFEIKTKDFLGAEFFAPIKFVQRIEDIAERFLEQIMVSLNKV